MILLNLITFLSAFLMFQIELIIAKLFLPNYGGSYLVWGSCVVFFQAVLLLGYVFAHTILQRWGIKNYTKVHLGLLFIPFLFFPGHAIHVQSAAGSQLPLVLDVFLRLLITIGPVFFVLSTASLVTQSWLSASGLPQRQNPYALYAISNLGSFAALLTYPFFFEQALTNTQQLNVWRLLYVVLVVANVIMFQMVKPMQQENAKGEAEAKNSIPWPQTLRWLLLSAAGVMMFLAVTNMVTYEVAPVPLLWVVPLGIYLLAFVLNFKSKPWCPLWISKYIGAVLGMSVGLFFIIQKHFFPVPVTIMALGMVLFMLCMYTQQELIATKPNRGGLTLFYVMISLGGFLGGIVTTWIIPLVSTSTVEYLTGLLLIACTLKDQSQKIQPWVVVAMLVALLLALMVWPKMVLAYHTLAVVLLFFVLSVCMGYLALRAKWIFIAFMAMLVLAAPLLESVWKNHTSIAKKRNYYGIYDVYDTPSGIRTIIHGTTLHGVQFVLPQRRSIPLGYYSPTSAVGEVLIKNIFEARHVGVVGLGAGTLALYASPVRSMDIYELDPDVYAMAKQYFWYLSLAPGDVRVMLGDARLSLLKNEDARYDLFIVDAFGGDSVPIHLVNKDVVELYRRHLTEQGGLLFHITNRYLSLNGVIAHIAKSLGGYAAIKDVPDGGANMRSIWAVLTWDQGRYVRLVTQEGWTPIEAGQYPHMRLWSDDYSNILPIINGRVLWASIKNFNWFVW